MSVRIPEIQGTGHQSPYANREVETFGVVTEVLPSGFYLQDAKGDGDWRTSDAIFVPTLGAPTVEEGDAVEVRGVVQEWKRAGREEDLSNTNLRLSETPRLVSKHNPLPEAVRLGKGGVELPNAIPELLATLESLEGMRVRMFDALSAGPITAFGELYASPDNGAGLERRTPFGGAQGTAKEPVGDLLRIRLSREQQKQLGASRTGDRFASVEGVLSYQLGDYQIDRAVLGARTPSNIEPEVTSLRGDAEHLTIASCNLLNLDPKIERRDYVKSDRDIDDDIGSGHAAAVAKTIAINLGSPDIVCLQEMQDNDGAENTGVTDSKQTAKMLIDKIVAAGGPHYEYIDAPPEDDKEGGQPGGNIRVGFLFNPERVRPDFSSKQRLGVGAPAFDNARKALSLVFEFNGEKVMVVNNHFSSRRGSTPEHGSVQPPVIGAEEERVGQAKIVHAHAAAAISSGAADRVVLCGDLNDFDDSAAVATLAGDSFEPMTSRIAAARRYSYIFQGRSGPIDQMLVDKASAASCEVDFVHVNTDFPGAGSDHDPQIMRLHIPRQAAAPRRRRRPRSLN